MSNLHSPIRQVFNGGGVGGGEDAGGGGVRFSILLIFSY